MDAAFGGPRDGDDVERAKAYRSKFAPLWRGPGPIVVFFDVRIRPSPGVRVSWQSARERHDR